MIATPTPTPTPEPTLEPTPTPEPALEPLNVEPAPEVLDFHAAVLERLDVALGLGTLVAVLLVFLAALHVVRHI